MSAPVNLLPFLRAHVASKYETQAEAARRWGVSPTFVSMVLSGTKHPTAAILADAGLEVGYFQRATPCPDDVHVYEESTGGKYSCLFCDKILKQEAS